jgi:hypothetical protein
MGHDANPRSLHLELLRQHHDAEWFVLSLWELREHERVQLINRCHSDRARLSRDRGICC